MKNKDEIIKKLEEKNSDNSKLNQSIKEKLKTLKGDKDILK